ncbi:MAG: hypothetical protein WBQ89_08945 [Candidatus Acidiferrum sp.]
MSTHRNKRVSLPAQPEPVPLAKQLANVEETIRLYESSLVSLKKTQAELKKQLSPVESQKLWPCRFCGAQVPYGEVYKHTEGHFESEVGR